MRHNCRVAALPRLLFGRGHTARAFRSLTPLHLARSVTGDEVQVNLCEEVTVPWVCGGYRYLRVGSGGATRGHDLSCTLAGCN